MTVLCSGNCHVWLGSSSLCTCEVYRVPMYVTITQLDTDKYIAYHPELPTVMSQADTPEEARANLVEATEMAIRHLVDNGLSIPQPMTFPLSVNLAMMFSGYSPFGPHAPGLSGPLRQQPAPAPDVPQSRLSAAERAGATHLSGDGLSAFTVRYGRVLQADWDGVMFGSWLDVGEEMPVGAVVLK